MLVEIPRNLTDESDIERLRLEITTAQGRIGNPAGAPGPQIQATIANGSNYDWTYLDTTRMRPPGWPRTSPSRARRTSGCCRRPENF